MTDVHPRGPLISIGDAAKICGVDYDTMLKWILNGAVAFQEVGPSKIKRLHLEDVKDLVRPGRAAL